MTEMRKDRRTPASLKVKYKSATVDDFIEQFGTDLSRGGIFIKTKKPLDTGALLKFEFQLQDGSALIHGVGRVAWRRVEQVARPDLPAGMGIKFFKLSDNSRQLVDRIESRFSRENSRYEQTEAAEFAPPLSAAPAAESSASGQNGRSGSLGSGSGPLTMPPPPANSSIPPALADVPASGSAVRTAPPPSMPPRAAAAATLSRSATAVGSKLGGPTSSAGFVAGALSSASAARVQPERVRRDPQSVELARELFGDLAGEPAANTGASARPSVSGTQMAASMPAEPWVDESVSNAVTTPPPASFNPPPLELPRPAASAAKSVRPPASDRAPSIEPQAVDAAPHVSTAAAAVAVDAPASSAIAAAAPVSTRPRSVSGRPSARVSRSPATASSSESPLKLAVKSTPPARAAQPAPKAGRSKPLVLVAFGATVLLAGAAAYVLLQRNRATEQATVPAPTAEPVPAVVAKPEPAAPPPTEAPSAAEPVAADPAAAVAEPAAAAATAEPAVAAAEPTPAQEPPPAAQPGASVAFQVTSVPRGAEVWLAGQRAGVTPLRLTLPAEVPVDLELRNRGFETAHRSVTPMAGMAPEAFELRALRYELTVETNPPGATVNTNKQTAVSPTPIDLGTPRASVAISVQLEGHQSTSRVVRLAEFQERNGMMRARVAVTLTPLPPWRRPAESEGEEEPEAPAAPPASAAPEAPPQPEAPPPVLQLKPVPETPAPSEPPAPGN